MSVKDLPDEELSATVTAWMRENLPPDWVRAIDAGDRDALAVARRGLDVADWWLRLGEAGWFYSSWPERYGGHGLEPAQVAVVNDVLRTYKAPMSDNPLGGNVGQALLLWGSEEQRKRFLEPIAKQQEFWVQLFSEPGAGSDLSGLSTRAVRDGDVWIVNGQKVWSSYAHLAQWGLLVARTDPDVPKTRGLSVFLLDMTAPGVTVRPLRHMSGEAHFSEVFFDDVVCPDAMRVGEVGDGWRMTSGLLTFERGGGGGGSATPGTDVGRNVAGLRARYGPFHDPELRQRVAQAYSREKIMLWTRMRIEGARDAGRAAGNERSILKLSHSHNMQELQNLSLDLEGMNALAHDPEDRWATSTVYAFLFSRSLTIAGGTSEIQRNIIGDKVLGLPREPSVDHDIPWTQVRRS